MTITTLARISYTPDLFIAPSWGPSDWYFSVLEMLSISAFLPTWKLTFVLHHLTSSSSLFKLFFEKKKNWDSFFLKTYKNGMINNGVRLCRSLYLNSWKMSYHSYIFREFVSVLNDKMNVSKTLNHQRDSNDQPPDQIIKKWLISFVYILFLFVYEIAKPVLRLLNRDFRLLVFVILLFFSLSRHSPGLARLQRLS